MPAFQPDDLITKPGLWRFTHNDIEFVAHGDDTRYTTLLDVANELDRVNAQCLKLLSDFMKHAGTFELDGVEVPNSPHDDGASVSLRYNFVADADPHEFNYTYFDVWLGRQSEPLPPFWPFKFVVGFH